MIFINGHMGEEFRRVFMPYCLIREMHKKQNVWLVLNREYKPLGFPTETWVDYQAFPWFGIKGVTEKFAMKLSYSAKAHSSHWPHRIYLYNDNCVPTRSKKHMDDYMSRVAMLMKKEVFLIKQASTTYKAWDGLTLP